MARQLLARTAAVAVGAGGMVAMTSSERLQTEHTRWWVTRAGRVTTAAVACQEPSSSSFAELDKLWETIQERKKAGDVAGEKPSWTVRLLKKGPEKCAQKVGEEAVECAIEAAAKRPEGLVKESADLLYHLLVLWTSMGVEPSEVFAELARREGTSGVAEKASRGKS